MKKRRRLPRFQILSAQNVRGAIRHDKASMMLTCEQRYSGHRQCSPVARMRMLAMKQGAKQISRSAFRRFPPTPFCRMLDAYFWARVSRFDPPAIARHYLDLLPHVRVLLSRGHNPRRQFALFRAGSRFAILTGCPAYLCFLVNRHPPMPPRPGHPTGGHLTCWSHKISHF